MRGDSAVDKELGQAEEHIVRPQTALNLNRQTLLSVLIDEGQQLNRTAILRPRCHKVVAPDMIRMLRPKPDTGAVGQPQSASGWLFLRHLESLPPPDPLHAFVIDPPAIRPQ